jgi:hypothetical protein
MCKAILKNTMLIGLLITAAAVILLWIAGYFYVAVFDIVRHQNAQLIPYAQVEPDIWDIKQIFRLASGSGRIILEASEDKKASGLTIRHGTGCASGRRVRRRSP